ncbi:helix-turn-helix transcriptional regulator [Candidatus Pacearchaeota archaeon]|nr:hypothetical protein [uncultured archaeon]MBS3084546.1 helix-turn-helix transcriptional regulator [Candidatus Pacearchaeota archaeon]
MSLTIFLVETGTVYPKLKSLKNEGFIKEEKKGKAVIYELTKKGKESLKNAKEKFSKIFSDVL